MTQSIEMSSELPHQLRTLEWLPPWQATETDFGAELRREASPGHPLYQVEAVAVARRVDQDDVLFWLPAGPTHLGFVHLTYPARRERPRDWPSTQLYSTVSDWVERVMRRDHNEFKRDDESTSDDSA
jgi:hypothetical protein